MPQGSFGTMDDCVAYIREATKQAVMETGKELLKIFVEDYVDKYAYSGAVTGEWYKPTGQFRAAWRKKTERLSPYMWQTKIYYNPSGVMDADEDYWQHFSKFSRRGSAIDRMDEMLNTQGVLGIFGTGENGTWYWSYREVAYFDKFMDDYYDTGEAERMLESNMNI